MRELKKRMKALENQSCNIISPETRREVARIVEDLQNRQLSPEQQRQEHEQLEKALAEIERRYGCR